MTVVIKESLLRLQADNQEEMEDWIQHLKNATQSIQGRSYSGPVRTQGAQEGDVRFSYLKGKCAFGDLTFAIILSSIDAGIFC